MCIRNVILFNCGHTRKLSEVCKYGEYEECPNGWKRNLIPEEGGVNIEIPIQKALWKCVFKCRPGVPAHDPLIDLAKEDVGIVKAEIEHQILSVLSTPATNPAVEKSGFNFDERFSSSLSRRRSNQTPTRTPKKERPTFLSTSSSYTDCGDAIECSPAAATDDFNPKLPDMKLNMASEKLRQLKIRKDDEIEDK